MERILVFCGRDWLHPKAGPVEHYVHEVFSRIARWGHYVLLVSHTHRLLRVRNVQPAEMQIIDGIQIARLGPRPLFGMMSRILLDRIHTNRNTITAFNALIDCVSAVPMSLSEHTNTPVIPLAFDLNPGVRASKNPPGPVIAASELARRKLIEAGFPKGFIVRAPHGATRATNMPSTPTSAVPTIVVSGNPPRVLRDALTILRRDGISVEVEVIGSGRMLRSPRGYRLLGAMAAAERAEVYHRAWIGFCGAGREQESLEMGACGLPAICANGEAGAEYVEDARSGFVYERRDARSLAERLRGLIADESLRRRLGARGRARAEEQSWDRTAGLVLAAIENLVQPSAPVLPPQDSCLARK